MNLFERGKIGKLELKNRFAMAPMGTKVDPGYILDERAGDYYAERAKGGFGLIFLGGMGVNDKYEPQEVPVISGFLAAGRLSDTVDKIHHAGAKVCVQLSAGVGRNCWFVDGKPPKSASDCDRFWNPGVKCIPFEREEIKDLVQSHGPAAKMAKTCGADALLLTAYGGYLTDQFLSELWNWRTDEYGGSFENRMRFLKECYEISRAEVGPDFPILIKYTPVHNLPGGRTLDEGVKMAIEFEKWGVDGLIVDLGCYDKWYLAIGTVYSPEGYHSFMSRAIKDAGVKIPILASGNQKNPEVAKRSIENGDLDFVLIGHQSKADPYFPAKIKAGREEDIRPCLGCNECLMAGQRGDGRHSCAVNPRCYWENYYNIKEAAVKKNVLVIGGGPAGAPDFKLPVRKLVKYYETQLEKAGITVCLNKAATVEAIKEVGFDHIICATGSSPVIPPIPGIDNEKVLSCDAAMCGEALKGNVVVIGGGLVGCEAAVQAAQTADKVTVVEIMDDILTTAHDSVNNLLELRKLITEAQLELCCGAKVIEITNDAVIYQKGDEQGSIPCDYVIVAVGYKPNLQFIEELKDNFDYDMLDVVGDAVGARKIWNAVHEGFHAALNI